MIIITDLYNTIGIEVLELLSSIIILNGIFQLKFKKAIYPSIGMVLIFSVFIIYLLESGNSKNLPPIYFIMELSIILVSIEEQLSKKIVFYMIAYISSYILSTLIRIILSMLFELNESLLWTETGWRTVVILLNLVVVSLISIHIKKRNQKDIYLIKNSSINNLIVMLPGLISCAFILAYVQIGRAYAINNIWDKVAVLSVTFICIFIMLGMIIFIIINCSRKYNEIKNEYKEKYLNIQLSYYKKIIEDDKEIRKFRHDICAHLGCMKLLAAEGKIQELTDYLSEVSDKVDRIVSDKLSSGNTIVDALINYMAYEAKKDNIKIVLEGLMPLKLKVSGSDLCTIFSNSLSNAIEACKNLEQGKERIINMSLNGKVSSSLFIVIENPIMESIEIERLNKGTTKKDKKNHGFGIPNMLEAVDNYNGNIKFINTNGKFRVEILLIDVI